MKRCRQCGEEKAQAQFALPHGRPSNICKVCYAETQLGIAQRPTSDKPPKIRTRYGEASGDTYQLWLDAQWRSKMAAASLAERGRHELSLQRQKEVRKQKWRDRRDIARYLFTNLSRALVAFGQLLPKPVLYGLGLLGAGGLGLWLFG